MNKIEELENKLKEEKNKMQANLKENYKWVVGKYVKFDEYSIMRIDNLRYIPINTVEDYYKNELDPNEAIYVDGPVAHYNVEDNYYSLAKHKNIQIKIRNIIEPDDEFENLVERLFNEAKKNLL